MAVAVAQLELLELQRLIGGGGNMSWPQESLQMYTWGFGKLGISAEISGNVGSEPLAKQQ